jgi:hypothetical protein
VPTPPAVTPPNAAFIDDPATISDKQLLVAEYNNSLRCRRGAVILPQQLQLTGWVRRRRAGG